MFPVPVCVFPVPLPASFCVWITRPNYSPFLPHFAYRLPDSGPGNPVSFCVSPARQWGFPQILFHLAYHNPGVLRPCQLSPRSGPPRPLAANLFHFAYGGVSYFQPLKPGETTTARKLAQVQFGRSVGLLACQPASMKACLQAGSAAGCVPSGAASWRAELKRGGLAARAVFRTVASSAAGPAVGFPGFPVARSAGWAVVGLFVWFAAGLVGCRACQVAIGPARRQECGPARCVV